jgi:hypothetical protein
MMDEDSTGKRAHKGHTEKGCPPGLEKQGRC